MCYNYKLLKTVGIVHGIKEILARTGLMAGAIFGLICFSLMPYYVYDIRITSESVPAAAVEEVLAEHGVKRGKTAFKLDKSALEVALQGLDGVAFATVSRRGAVISVILEEELPPVSIHDVAEARQVVSAHDAIISRQLIYSGTPLYKKGDAVKTGAVLVDGAISIGEARVEVAANAEVYGIVLYKSSILYGESYTERVRSGNESTSRAIDFLGLPIYNEPSPYAMYETLTTRQRCGYLMPLDVTTLTYYELIDEAKTTPFSEVEARLRAEAISAAEGKAPEGARVTGRHVRITETGGNYLIEATVQVEQRIDSQDF